MDSPVNSICCPVYCFGYSQNLHGRERGNVSSSHCTQQCLGNTQALFWKVVGGMLDFPSTLRTFPDAPGLFPLPGFKKSFFPGYTANHPGRARRRFLYWLVITIMNLNWFVVYHMANFYDTASHRKVVTLGFTEFKSVQQPERSDCRNPPLPLHWQPSQ